MSFDELREYVLDSIGKMKNLGLYAKHQFMEGGGSHQTATLMVTGKAHINAMMDLDIPKAVFKATDWSTIKARLVAADVRKKGS